MIEVCETDQFANWLRSLRDVQQATAESIWQHFHQLQQAD